MEIRKATIFDYDILIKLFHELDTNSIEQQPKHFQRSKRSKEYIGNIINDTNSDFLLCIKDDIAIGFSLIFMKEIKGLNLLVPCKYAYIQDIVMTSDYRSKGFGKKLMDASKNWALDNGAEYLRLSVMPQNEKGIKFYKKYGLTEQMITMECKL